MNKETQTSVIVNHAVISILRDFNERDELECIEERMAFMKCLKCYADSASIGMMLYLSEK